MEKVFWAIQGRLAGRPGPIMEPWNARRFRDAGITTVLSADHRCDAEGIRAAGLKHIPVIIPAEFPTTPKLVNKFAELAVEAVEKVMIALDKGEVVLVHCYAGRDRTGLILCGTLMAREGLTPDAALRRVLEVQPLALSSPGLMDVYKEYEIRVR